MAAKKGKRKWIVIVQEILEHLLRAGPQGVVKSTLIQLAGLKTEVGMQYLEEIERAGYAEAFAVEWGQREVTKYRVTELGRQRIPILQMIIGDMGGSESHE